MKGSRKIPYFLYLLAVVCSILSQVPSFLESGIDSYLKMSWVLPFTYLAITSPKSIMPKCLFTFLICSVVFTFYCFTMETFTGMRYLNVDYYNILLSLFITMTSYSLWSRFRNENFLIHVSIALLICAVYLSYVVYTSYFIDYDILSRKYAFQAKNSMGQILFACILIANVFLLKKNKAYKIASLIISAIVFYVILILKSRATFLGIIYVVYFFCTSFKNKYVRRTVVLICVILFLVLLTNPNLQDTLINGIIFAGRDIHDIDDISSDRIPRLMECLGLLSDNLFFGIGYRYEDCFPVIILVQYGIIGAAVVYYLCFNIYVKIRHYNNNNVELLAYLFFVVYMINSLFEAQPPFGPGAKCFFLWMFVGFAFAQKDEESVNYNCFQNLDDKLNLK